MLIYIIFIFILIIVIWGAISNWKFITNSIENYDENKPIALKLLQEGVDNSKHYSRLGNKLAPYFMETDFLTQYNWNKEELQLVKQLLKTAKNFGMPLNTCAWSNCFSVFSFLNLLNNNIIEKYIKYIKTYLPKIKTELSKIKSDLSVKDDAVIHIRCSDVPFYHHIIQKNYKK